MAAPPPTDSLIAALLAAVLGVFAPATGFVVTVLKPAPTTACSPGTTSAGVTPSARNLVAPTTTAGAGSPGWQELAATLSGELAESGDPEAQKLAQAIGDTGTPDTAGSPTTGSPTARARDTAVPRTATPGPSAARARPGTGPCPAPSAPSAPATRSRSTQATQPSSAGRSDGRRWEQLAGQLAAALAGSTDPRAVELQAALDRAGFPSSRPATTASRATGAAPRTTSTPGPADPGG